MLVCAALAAPACARGGLLSSDSGSSGSYSGFHSGYSSSSYNSYSGYSRSSSSRQLEVYIEAALAFILLIVRSMQRVKISSNYASMDAQPMFGRGLARNKDEETRNIISRISAMDPQVSADKLAGYAQTVFMKLQDCWQKRDYEPMRPLLMPYLFEEHQAQINEMTQHHEINRMDDLQIVSVDLINIQYTRAPKDREFSALITAKARDYYVDDKDGQTLRGDSEPQTFQEVWVFHWNNNAWLLRAIEQTTDSGGLDKRSFVEDAPATPAPHLADSSPAAQQFTDPAPIAQVVVTPSPIPQIHLRGPVDPLPVQNSAQFVMPLMPLDGKTPPPAPAVHSASIQPHIPLPPLAPGKVDSLLAALSAKDPQWQPQLLRERAKEVFLNYQTALEAQSLYMLPQDNLTPQMRDQLQTLVDKFKSQAMRCRLDNLSVLRVDIVMAETRDIARFTARIQSHAQRVITRGLDTTYQDKAMCLFSNLWEFELQDGKWTLAEILKDISGHQPSELVHETQAAA
jgi:hypothetical protein